MKEKIDLTTIGRHVCNLFMKLVNFVTMRRLLTRLISRVLLSRTFTPTMGMEAEIHSQGRRKMVVGLGNTGMDGTRHSVGMAVLEALAARLGVGERWRVERQVSGDVIVWEAEHAQVVLLRPRLLMNVNGVAVARAVGKYSVRPEDVLLVHDELDKPLGRISLKHGGSARGHNGVRSCIDCLQTQVMRRVRVGIGRPRGSSSVERHVLGRFSSSEQEVLASVLVQSVDLILAQILPQDSQLPSSPPGGRPRPLQQTQDATTSDLHKSTAQTFTVSS